MGEIFMKIERFGEFKTGEIEPILAEGKFPDYAFIPKRLPPLWKIPERLFQLVAEARDRVGTLAGTGSILPNPALLLRPLQKREAIKSNSIEGTYVKAQELLLFEAEKNYQENDQPINPSEKRLDWGEVLLYERAINIGCERIASGSAIDVGLICDLHRLVLMGARGQHKDPGLIRDTQVFVEAGRRYIPPPQQYLGELLEDLVKYMTTDHLDPLVRAFITHYQFEAIHPFKDGNGRIGRILLSLCIHKWLRHSHAWLYLSEFFDKHRTEYFNRLLSISTNGEWDEWIEFCLLGTIEQAEVTLARCRKLIEIKKDYEAKFSQHNSRMSTIISMLFDNPMIEVVQVQRELNISYKTARGDLLHLCKHNVIRDMEMSRPRVFCADEIFETAYMG